MSSTGANHPRSWVCAVAPTSAPYAYKHSQKRYLVMRFHSYGSPLDACLMPLLHLTSVSIPLCGTLSVPPCNQINMVASASAVKPAACWSPPVVAVPGRRLWTCQQTVEALPTTTSWRTVEDVVYGHARQHLAGRALQAAGSLLLRHPVLWESSLALP